MSPAADDPTRGANRARPTVLLVEDDDLFRRSLHKVLKQHYRVSQAADADAAVAQLTETSPDLVLLDIMLPGTDGLQVLKELRRRDPELTVLMLTAVEKISTVVEAIQLGATDYLTKPVDTDELVLTIDRALEAAAMKRELAQRRELQRLSNQRFQLIGESPVIRQVRHDIDVVAGTDATVLLEGETGTGKEVVARGIHAASKRGSGAFVPVNCGALPKDLIEAEFFGHARGAFTGADRSGIGKFELAHGGTLLLDEIGELTLDAQVKLLRVLEEQEFYPVGGSRLRRVDVRVIAATNRDLQEQVQQGTFREDLYFRLNVFRIVLPPLRERGEDVMLLAEHFLAQLNRKFSKHFTGFEPEAAEALLQRSWPGNVRELRNLIERLVLAEDGERVTLPHLAFLRPLGMGRYVPAGSTALTSGKSTWDESTAGPSAPAESSEGAADEATAERFRLPAEGLDLEDLEKALMRQALEQAKQNKAKAARLLNLSPPTFYYRLQKYGIE